MVSERTVSSLRIWAQNCGAVFPQDAELGKVAEKARKVLSGASREDLGELQLMFAIGMEPFVVALRAGGRFPKGETELGETVFEAYKIISFRTRLNQIYERIVNSEDLWRGVESHLMRAFRGDTLAPPARVPGRAARPVLPIARGRSALGLSPPAPTRRGLLSSHLGSRWVVSFYLALASPVPYHMRDWVETGRNRLILLAVSSLLAGAAILYFMYGPDLCGLHHRRVLPSFSQELGL